MPGVFFAAPILTPILPSPPSRSRLSTPARFAPALVISRYVSDSPRAKTPWGERVQATIPPPGVPPPATCPVTNQSRWCSGGRYPQDTLFSRRGAREPRALSWTSRLDNARNRRDTAFPPRFRRAISAGCARGAPSRAVFGGTISRDCDTAVKVQSLPRPEKKNTIVL